MRADYLDFFRETLAQLEEDFPNRFLDQVGLQGPDGLKGIPNSDSLPRWACVEAWMYTFTREQPYLDRARELLMMIVEMIEKTPLVLWRYVHPKDPETTEDIRKAYAAFPGSGWHIGGFSNQIGYGDCCLIIDRFSGWRNDRERERARDAGAELCDFRVDKSSLYHFDDEQLNIVMVRTATKNSQKPRAKRRKKRAGNAAGPNKRPPNAPPQRSTLQKQRKWPATRSPRA